MVAHYYGNNVKHCVKCSDILQDNKCWKKIMNNYSKRTFHSIKGCHYNLVKANDDFGAIIQ